MESNANSNTNHQNDSRVDVNLISEYQSYEDSDASWNESPLHFAIDISNAKIVIIVLSARKKDVNIKTSNPSYKEHRNPLHMAVLMKNIEIIKLLVNHGGIDINAVDKDS